MASYMPPTRMVPATKAVSPCHTRALESPPLTVIVTGPVFERFDFQMILERIVGVPVSAGSVSWMLLPLPVSMPALSLAPALDRLVLSTDQIGSLGGSVSPAGASTNLYARLGSIQRRHSPRKSSKIGFVFSVTPVEST